MKQRIILVSLVLITLVGVTSVEAKDTKYNVRFLIHSIYLFQKSGWGLVDWNVLPNYAIDPSANLHIFGMRYEKARKVKNKKVVDWSIEVMTGFLVKNQEGIGLINIRWSYNLGFASLWGEKGYFWGRGKWYIYTEVDRQILTPVLIGLETENELYHKEGQNNLSCGPHLKLKFKEGAYILVLVHQRHNFGPNQIWFRTILNF